MDPKRPSPWLIAAALLTLYIVWGSTYLGMRWAVEAFPPFFVAGARAVSAGAFLYILLRLRGTPGPTRRQWRDAAIVGALLLLGGNAMVTVASRYIPSSICALMLGMLPVWMVILDRGSPARGAPSTWFGVGLGLAGVSLLAAPEIREAFVPAAGGGAHKLQALGMALLLGSPLSWAIGSLYSRRADRPASAFLGTGMQLLAGGGLLMVVSVATGEFGRLANEPVFASTRPILALVYLAVFGSLLGYTAYIWLLDRVSPALVSTYAYVNPVVAVVLGAWLGGEQLTGRILLAAAIIIAGVVVIVNSTQRRKRAAAARAIAAPADSDSAVPGSAIPITVDLRGQPATAAPPAGRR